MDDQTKTKFPKAIPKCLFVILAVAIKVCKVPENKCNYKRFIKIYRMF